MNKTDFMNISVIIPLYNESSTIWELFQRLRAALEPFEKRYEIIFVDDGSTDGSFSVLKEIYELNDDVGIVRLRKNFGKTVALLAGFTESRGEIVVTMDSDLQDSPAEIPNLIKRLEEGYDLVCGWKFERKDPFIRRLFSKIFNRAISFFSDVKIHDSNCGLKVFRREVLMELDLYGEMHRFIPVLASWKGFMVGEVKVKHFSRRYGKSRFGPNRYFRGFFDFLTVMMLLRYVKRPLHLFGGLGMLIGLIGFAINIYLSIGWIYGRWIGHRPLLILGVLMIIIGIQTIFFGLMAEMMNYLSSKEMRPSISQILRTGIRSG